MKVSEYIDYLITGEASKLTISDVGDMSLNPIVAPTATQIVNQFKFINYINLANLAIHKRFYVLQKSIELDFPVDGEEYTLPSNFLIPIRAYYTSDLTELPIRDEYVNLVDNIDTAVSLLIPEPFKAVIKGTDSNSRKQITLNYVAAPIKATTVATDLKITETYTEAILMYAAYKAHTAIDGHMEGENNTYYLRYESACKQLVTSGMWGNDSVGTNSKLIDNGFV